MYHVRTESNPADVGTRPGKVKLTDIGPGYRWENGDAWMRMNIEDAVNSGVLKPATSLRVSKELEDEFKKGLVFGDRDEVLSGGFNANIATNVSEVRKQKLVERIDHSNYILFPPSLASQVQSESMDTFFPSSTMRGRARR